MFNIQHSSDRLEFDIYAHTNNGPFEFQLSGNEKSVPGDEVLQISKMSPRQKIEYRLNSPYRTSCDMAGQILMMNTLP